MNNLLRDLFEGLFVVAIGGILWSSVVKLKHHQIAVVTCPSCGRPTSRAYVACTKCGS